MIIKNILFKTKKNKKREKNIFIETQSMKTNSNYFK